MGVSSEAGKMPERMKTDPLTGKLTFTSLKPLDLSKCTKQEIKEYFENSYDLNESIFTGLKDDSVFYRYPDRLRLPLIFYYAHTACVYVNKLVLAGLIKPQQRPNLEFETLFETGVDEMSWDDTENYRMGGKFVWPKVEEVVEYRRQVRKMILQIIEETPLTLPITRECNLWGLMMGMEHERIHLETSSVLIRQLPISMVTKPDDWKYSPPIFGSGAGKNALIKVPETTVTLGKPYDFPSYGWDNEYGNWTTTVPEFEASKYLVTNKEFYEFVKSGGYKNKSFWSEESWKWVQFVNAEHPTFWVCDQECQSGCGGDLTGYSHCKPAGYLTNGQNSYCNGHSVVDGNGHQGKDEGGGFTSSTQYKFRCMFDVIDMPWDWPVEVNYHEAKAFCAWKGPQYRLPAEAEHHIMRGPQAPVSEGTSCDIIYQDELKANLNMSYGSSTPVNMYPSTGEGFYDVSGNVWEWVEDHFNGLPGYSSDPLYDDFSSPCFDGKHTMILGGSWVSTGDEASRFARFAFRRHFFQHLGFRLARSVDNKDDQFLPVRLVKDKVFVLGADVNNTTKQNNLCIKGEWVKSTNVQFTQETVGSLYEQLWDSYSHKSVTKNITKFVGQTLEKYSYIGRRGLHIGCGLGTVSFQIAPCFSELLSTDYSGRFIDVCLRMQKGETVSYQDSTITPRGDEGPVIQTALPSNVKSSNIVFKQLTWLPNEVGCFDVVLLTNIGRLLNPKAWLIRFNEVVKKGGILMITTTGRWDTNALQSALASRFSLAESCKMETETNSDLTIWRHK